jgi:hypothetical protein
MTLHFIWFFATVLHIGVAYLLLKKMVKNRIQMGCFFLFEMQLTVIVCVLLQLGSILLNHFFVNSMFFLTLCFLCIVLLHNLFFSFLWTRKLSIKSFIWKI